MTQRILEDQSVIHVIQSTYFSSGANGDTHTEVAIEVGEGWFVTAAAAESRADELNQKNRQRYDVAMDRSRRERETKIEAATRTNIEAAILRKNGIDKKDVPVPKPFEPVPFAEYIPWNPHTSYAVVRIRRSDYDFAIVASGEDSAPTSGGGADTA